MELTFPKLQEVDDGDFLSTIKIRDRNSILPPKIPSTMPRETELE